MKISTNRPPVPFTPVSLTLTFESQAELDAMGKLFNVTFITDAFSELAGCEPNLWKELEKLGANIQDSFATYAPHFRNHSGFRQCANSV